MVENKNIEKMRENTIEHCESVYSIKYICKTYQYKKQQKVVMYLYK